MRKLNIRILLVCFLLFPAHLLWAENDETNYDRRVKSYQDKWQNLVPKYVKMQFAGSMGLISVGPGWGYGKNKQWETDVLLGYVPRYETDEAKMTATIKQSFIPWNIKLKNKFSVDPLSCSIYANTIFGNGFWVREPDRYPEGYYNFSTKVRFNIAIGQRLTRKIDHSHRKFFKSVSLFYEFHVSDLYAVSAFSNKYLKPKDYIGFSVGTKLQFF